MVTQDLALDQVLHILVERMVLHLYFRLADLLAIYHFLQLLSTIKLHPSQYVGNRCSTQNTQPLNGL